MHDFKEFMGFVEDNYQIKEIKGIDLETAIKSTDKLFLFLMKKRN